MAWRSVLQPQLPIRYAWNVAGTPPANWSEETKEWVHEYQKLFRLAQDLDNALLVQREETKRLEHENAFMLKLIERNNNDC